MAKGEVWENREMMQTKWACVILEMYVFILAKCKIYSKAGVQF